MKDIPICLHICIFVWIKICFKCVLNTRGCWVLYMSGDSFILTGCAPRLIVIKPRHKADWGLFATGRYLSIGTAPASQDYDNSHLTITSIWIQLKLSYDDEFYLNSIKTFIRRWILFEFSWISSWLELCWACNLQFQTQICLQQKLLLSFCKWYVIAQCKLARSSNKPGLFAPPRI